MEITAKPFRYRMVYRPGVPIHPFVFRRPWGRNVMGPAAGEQPSRPLPFVVMGRTHEVTNQVPPLIGHDPIAGDAVLVEACLRHADRAALGSLAGLGRLAGSEQAQEWGRLANENPPRLRTHDRYGNRIDEVEFHPAWHELMRTAMEHGLGGAPWAPAGTRFPHVRRA